MQPQSTKTGKHPSQASGASAASSGSEPPQLTEKHIIMVLILYRHMKLGCLEIQKFGDCFVPLLNQSYIEYIDMLKPKLKDNDTLSDVQIKWVVDSLCKSKKGPGPLMDCAKIFVSMYKDRWGKKTTKAAKNAFVAYYKQYYHRQASSYVYHLPPPAMEMPMQM